MNTTAAHLACRASMGNLASMPPNLSTVRTGIAQTNFANPRGYVCPRTTKAYNIAILTNIMKVHVVLLWLDKKQMRSLKAMGNGL